MTDELPGRADLVQQLVLPNLNAVAAALGREREGGEVNFAEIRTAIKDQPAKAKQSGEAWNS